MANAIAQLQNEPVALRLLAGQRRLYAWAKRVLAIQVIVVVAGPGILLLLENTVPAFKVWGALLGLLFSIVDIALFEPVKTSLQRKAAAVQELFDCRVLDLDWPALKGSPPDLEDAPPPSSSPDVAGLRDWYPPGLDSLPIYVARVICQRSNRWWDAKLRRFYRVGLLALVLVASAAVTALGLLRHLSLADFVLSFMAPILPLLLWGIRQAQRQGEAANRLDHLKTFGDRLWNEICARALAAGQASANSRLFQDEIFEHRQRSPLVFDWFYRLFKADFQERLEFNAREMIKEARSAGL
jgi:hypothetical protein